MTLAHIIALSVIGGLVGIVLIFLAVISIYNKATEEKFRQERIRRLLEGRERKDPFPEFLGKEEKPKEE